MSVVYRPQYRGDETLGGWRWHSAGIDINEAEALNMIRAKLSEYTGPHPTKRMTRVTTEVMTIETSVKFKENN
jgi:hypothetical protein